MIRPVRGHAVFVPDHAWNKPDWATRVDVLTFLFGVKQIGVSLVHHQGRHISPFGSIKDQHAGRIRRSYPQHLVGPDGSCGRSSRWLACAIINGILAARVFAITKGAAEPDAP